jgi:hypothetical protein
MNGRPWRDPEQDEPVFWTVLRCTAGLGLWAKLYTMMRARSDAWVSLKKQKDAWAVSTFILRPRGSFLLRLVLFFVN